MRAGRVRILKLNQHHRWIPTIFGTPNWFFTTAPQQGHQRMTPRSTNSPGSCPSRRIRRLAKGLMTNTPKKVAAYGNPKEKACKEALGSHTVCLQHPHQKHHFEQSGELYDFTWLRQCCLISWDGKNKCPKTRLSVKGAVVVLESTLVISDPA